MRKYVKSPYRVVRICRPNVAFYLTSPSFEKPLWENTSKVRTELLEYVDQTLTSPSFHYESKFYTIFIYTYVQHNSSYRWQFPLPFLEDWNSVSHEVSVISNAFCLQEKVHDVYRWQYSDHQKRNPVTSKITVSVLRLSLYFVRKHSLTVWYEY